MSSWRTAIGGVIAAGSLLLPASAVGDALVSSGSPQAPQTFSQNKQNEPTVAIDPATPGTLVAGSNDEIDMALCGFDGNTPAAPCAFNPGIGSSGVYFSANGGSWTQPTYQGTSARTGTTGPGPIGTVPNYDTAGLVADGDPGVAFGPQLVGGRFTYADGAELYYSNLTANSATVRTDQAFKGYEAIAVSRTSDLTGAQAGTNSAWSAPVIVSASHQSSTTFSDKPSIWADNAASSPFFGTVYECYTQFRSNHSAPAPIAVSRSTDGGQTFSVPTQLTQAADNNTTGGRQACVIRTSSTGIAYLFYGGTFKKQSAQMMVRSFDGGAHWGSPVPVAAVADVGASDGEGDVAFDGVAGARTNSFPSVSIANGAPMGTGAPNTIAVGWSDARNGLNHEQSLVTMSTDGGATFSAPVPVSGSGDRPDFTAIALSPDGTRLYVTYDNFLTTFQSDFSNPRLFQGLVRRGTVSGSSVSDLSTVYHGAVGDARGSSANLLEGEFLGDYNAIDATNSGATAVFNDGRSEVDCPAVDAYRTAYLAGTAGTPPNPDDPAVCPGPFGNSDIYSATVAGN